MNRTFSLTAVLLLCACFTYNQAPAAQPDEEEQLIALLGSSATPKEKDAACARLKRIGSRSSIDALATLLHDEQLSHSARYALESMPYEEAGKALTAALVTTNQVVKLGIIGSLAARREAASVEALSGLLGEPDTQTASAAAQALGRIGGSAAVARLQSALPDAAGVLRSSLQEGLLIAATKLLDAGKNQEALPVFRLLKDQEGPDYIRGGAFRGTVLSSPPDDAAKLICAGLLSEDGPTQEAALEAIRTAGSAGDYISILPRLRPNVRAAVIEGLGQRGDSSITPALITHVGNESSEVRLASINALGLVGTSASIEVLAQAAARGAEQAAARQALVQLRGEEIGVTMLGLLRASTAPVQAELARALGDRRETHAVPALLALAGEKSAAEPAALHALAALASESDVPALLELVLQASDVEAKRGIVEALNTALHRIQLHHRKVNLVPVIEAAKTSSVENQSVLLPILSGFMEAGAAEVLLQSATSEEGRLAEAAKRALCDTVDPSLLPNITALVSNRENEQIRTLAIAGAVRLWAQDEPARVSSSAKLDSARSILNTSLTPQQTRMVLAGLASMPSIEALEMAEAQLLNDAVRAEAARAVVALAPGVNEPKRGLAALEKIAVQGLDQGTVQAIRSARDQLQARFAYLTKWEACGPFRQPGENYSTLFDVPFPPESQSQPGGTWRRVPLSSDASKPFSMDLLRMFGGEQAVAYARARFTAQQEQPVLIELGSDDGVKAWLNGKLIHANNTARPLQPASDKINAVLQKGQNDLLLKITQNNLGWEFCVRLLASDGSLVNGLLTE